MIVKCVRENYNGEKKHPNLEIGKEYCIFHIFINKERGNTVVLLADSDYIGDIGSYPLGFFEMTDSSIPDGWQLQGDIVSGNFSISPLEFTDNIWNSFFEDGDLEAEKIFTEVYQKIKAFHNFKDEEDIKKMYNRGIHEKTATILEDGWVMCPECFNAMKADPNIGEIICDNIYCQTKLNNPYAKPYPKDDSSSLIC